MAKTVGKGGVKYLKTVEEAYEKKQEILNDGYTIVKEEVILRGKAPVIMMQYHKRIE